ncbi:MAG: FecR domain-containing protein [Bacteroidota bacterium]
MQDSLPNDYLLSQWISGELTEEEKVAWESSATQKEVKRILEHSENLNVAATRSKAEAWEMLNQKIQQPTPVVNMRRRYMLWGSAVAAALALVFLLIPFSGGQTSYLAEVGSQSQVRLPDGSSAELNAGSEITLTEEDWQHERALNLTGEAFFEVKKGSKFVVTTDQISVEVLGTSFNVQARPQLSQVSCYTGKVRVVDNKSQQEIILTPGQTARWSKESGLQTTAEALSAKPEWLTGKFVYKNVPLSLVLDELERQFNVSINHESTDEFSGGFDKSDLEQALYQVCSVMGLTYTFEDDKRSRIKLTPEQN